jgi:hypothetical protein
MVAPDSLALCWFGTPFTNVQIGPSCVPAASFVPSQEEAIQAQSEAEITDCKAAFGKAIGAQFVPKLLEVHTTPPLTTAASFIPLVDEAMENQVVLVGPVDCVQLVPELLETQTPPPLSTAASLVPSADDAMENQFGAVGAWDCIQFVP